MKALASERERTNQRVARLLAQPGPGGFNRLLGLVTFAMIAAWPVGWGLIALNVVHDKLIPLDIALVPLPAAAVLGGFFLARARLADRGALALLSLGFGALAPARKGEPSLCRRCGGPLPSAGLGGIVQCLYCSSENIEGLDLRPVADSLRSEHQGLDVPLRRRGRERLLWSVLTGVALVALAGWVGATASYARSRPTIVSGK